MLLHCSSRPQQGRWLAHHSSTVLRWCASQSCLHPSNNQAYLASQPASKHGMLQVLVRSSAPQRQAAHHTLRNSCHTKSWLLLCQPSQNRCWQYLLTAAALAQHMG